MTFYEEMRVTADELLDEFGVGGLIRRQDGSEYPVKVVLVNYSDRLYASGLMKMTDKRAILSAHNLPFEPEENEDTLIVNGIEHSIVNPNPVRPASTTVLWEMTARQ